MKIERHRAAIEKVETSTPPTATSTGRVGITARAARRAVQILRKDGRRVGLFRPITLWPFPEQALRQAAGRARHIVVPELNLGQLALEVERLVDDSKTVIGLNRVDGEPITPDQIVARVRELAGHE